MMRVFESGKAGTVVRIEDSMYTLGQTWPVASGASNADVAAGVESR